MNQESQLPPTRTSLLLLRRRLDEAQQGHELLERKREVLLRELWSLLQQVAHHERDVRRRFAAAYRALSEARLASGSERIGWAALAPAAETRYRVDARTVMGVALPRVRLEVEPLPLPYSPFGTGAGFDEARERWLRVGEVLGSWVETIGAVWRVAADLEKTQRRVNALEHVLIPEYRAAIGRIEAAMEEQEREAFMRAKRVKERRETT